MKKNVEADLLLLISRDILNFQLGTELHQKLDRLQTKHSEKNVIYRNDIERQMHSCFTRIGFHLAQCGTLKKIRTPGDVNFSQLYYQEFLRLLWLNSMFTTQYSYNTVGAVDESKREVILGGGLLRVVRWLNTYSDSIVENKEMLRLLVRSLLSVMLCMLKQPGVMHLFVKKRPECIDIFFSSIGLLNRHDIQCCEGLAVTSNERIQFQIQSTFMALQTVECHFNLILREAKPEEEAAVLDKLLPFLNIMDYFKATVSSNSFTPSDQLKLQMFKWVSSKREAVAEGDRIAVAREWVTSLDQLKADHSDRMMMYYFEAQVFIMQYDNKGDKVTPLLPLQLQVLARLKAWVDQLKSKVLNFKLSPELSLPYQYAVKVLHNNKSPLADQGEGKLNKSDVGNDGSSAPQSQINNTVQEVIDLSSEKVNGQFFSQITDNDQVPGKTAATAITIN